MRNRKANNDILKDFIKSHDGYMGILGITGAQLANAGRAKLDFWVADMGGQSEHLISDYRAKDKFDITPKGNEQRKEKLEAERLEAERVEKRDAEVVEPVKPVADDPATAIGGAIIDARGDLGAKDQELRDDVTMLAEVIRDQGETIERLETELNEGKIANLHVKIGDKPVVDAGKVHKRFGDLLAVATCRCHAFLTGGAGSFKTSSAEKVAEVLGLECSAISISSQTTETKLLGYMNAEGKYVTTEFRKRYETGGIFILDEVDNGNPNTLAVLNSALANGNCAFADGMVTKHEDFVLIATANTFGSGGNAQYVGRNALDQATLDRFSFLEWDYDNELELHIASNKAWCKDVQAIRKAVDDLKIKAVVSPRATFEGAKLLEAGMDYKSVLFAKVWKGLAKDAVSKILAKVESNGHTLSGKAK